MSNIAILNGSTVTNFIENKEVFDKCVKECFDIVDVDKNEGLSRAALRERFPRVFALGYESQPKSEIDKLYDMIFDKFDEDKNGKIDRNEFKSLITEVLLALARGLGNSPVQVTLFQDSLLSKAVQLELAGTKNNKA